MVVGQDLDNIDGGFSISQTFHGYLADYQIYDIALLRPAMSDFINCNDISAIYLPLINLNENMTTLTLKGDTDVFLESDTEICNSESQVLLLFPEKKNFKDSVSWCSTLKGALYLPNSNKDNKKSFETFEVFHDECVDSWGTLYWLGIKMSSYNNKWAKLEDGSSLKYDNFTVGWNNPSEEYQCASVGGKTFPYQWFSAPCDTNMCALCKFNIHPKLRVRGLCKSSLIDRTLFIYRYRNGRPALDGAYYSSIFWDGQEWVLGNRRYLYLMGQMSDIRSDYPIGIHNWIVYGDKCDKQSVSSNFFFQVLELFFYKNKLN